LRPDFERTYPLQPTYPARRRVISANQFHLSYLLQVGTGAGGGTSRSREQVLDYIFRYQKHKFHPLISHGFTSQSMSQLY